MCYGRGIYRFLVVCVMVWNSVWFLFMVLFYFLFGLEL